MKKRNRLKLRLDKETLRRLEQVESPDLRNIAGGCGTTKTSCGCTQEFLCSDSVCVNACP